MSTDDPTDLGARWTIVEATEPQELLEATALFDDDVTMEGAIDSLSRSGHHLLLALAADREPIGFISAVEMRHPDKQPEVFINELGVAEPWRRQGVARALLTALGDLARTQGVTTVWTATEPDNSAALAAYRSIGADTSETAVMISIDLTDD